VRLLDVWPALPLFIQEHWYYPTDDPEYVDNVLPALKQGHRACTIDLEIYDSRLEILWAAMQESFPQLIDLIIDRSDKMKGIPDQIPDSFLGGSAPRLRRLQLGGIPFPGLPKLLLSTTQLAILCLSEITHSGYISPETMVTCLSMLTSLEEFTLMYYQCDVPDQENQYLTPEARVVLPALTNFDFTGATNYSEYLLARIDAPRLIHLSTIFFDQFPNFDNPHLVQLISRTPSFETPKKACLNFNEFVAQVELSSDTSGYGELYVGIDSSRQLTPLAQICTSSLPPLSTVEELCISENRLFEPNWDLDVVGVQWLELLHPFVSAKNLYVDRYCVLCVAFALRELLEGRTTRELPVLQNLFLEDFGSRIVQEVYKDFVAARKLSGNSITVTKWDRKSRWDKF
jgi:hypothetical protein